MAGRSGLANCQSLAIHAGTVSSSCEKEQDMDSGHIPSYSVQHAEGELVARSSKEDLKALFYVFAGKPDSVIKVFPRQAIVTPEDL